MDAHYWVLITIMLAAGLFGGVVNYFRQSELEHNPKLFIKAIFLGIAASALVPLFLQMILSGLISIQKIDVEYDKINYFVFTGFCLVASIFSNRFIEGIAQRVLKEVEEAKNAANDAIEKIEETEEKVDLMATRESEPEGQSESEKQELQSISDEIKSQEGATIILTELAKQKYKFRTVNGVAKNVKIDREDVLNKLIEFQKQGVASKVRLKDKTFWALTDVGIMVASGEKKSGES